MATQPPKGPPIKVDIWAWADENRKIWFDHDWEVEGNSKKNKGRIDITQGAPPTEIRFQFKDDKTGLHLKFCSPASEAMYVGLAPNCPPPAGNGGQITYLSRQDKKLDVEDANIGPECLLKYALRFDGDPNPQGPQDQRTPPYVYDPELKNGGGGIVA